MKRFKHSFAGLLLALAASALSSCTSTDTHVVRTDHYIHDVPSNREYYSDHPYYGEPTYSATRYRDAEPSDFDVVNQYDRQAR